MALPVIAQCAHLEKFLRTWGKARDVNPQSSLEFRLIELGRLEGRRVVNN